MRAGPLVLSLLVLLSACDDRPQRTVSAEGRYGGVFNLNVSGAIRSIFPPTITQASEVRIMGQVYEGLVSFDPATMATEPCLADSWEVDTTHTIWTFHLRQGVRFHDDPAFTDGIGRTLTADDVVRCFTAICTQGIGDGTRWLFQDRVVGATEHYLASRNGQPLPQGVEGIRKVDDSTVRITLTHPDPNILRIIAHQGCWIWPQELTEAYARDINTHAIGTGAFRLRGPHTGGTMVLERNPVYWRQDAEGRALPYLDAVRITFDPDRNAEFDQFLKGRVTALFELPVDRLSALKDSVDPATGEKRFTFLSVPGYASQFYCFDIHHPPFNDVRVRKAFALAVDRRTLVDQVLGGLASPADHGIVAPGLKNYPYNLVRGFHFDPDSARLLLASAGYPQGRGFPPLRLQVSADGFGYVRVAEAVLGMIERELNVPITLSVLPAEQHLALTEHLKARFWREGWSADHPDPENFLAMLYGKNAAQDTALASPLNTLRYHSRAFDTRFEQAIHEPDENVRSRLLAEAENIAMNDVPAIPLYHDRSVLLTSPRVMNLRPNPLDLMDLGTVWFNHKQVPAQ
ncbi:MAG: ABC transporter substrate-binding protein [Bacteroidetes bacterium]|nr:ABC transporter substrate-binding protein [Bacteroidota bacterium]MBX7130176.1 ABC transporter substrate-binding protein [Flavobacteriales bacterium]MCC6655223.1 ABC transporter substrate-binding protein [Flavobacteriales bacterium]HMU12430.1 ABC transporter substrate-binding protein [Flavobacteriales bacterium]HNA31571.1 ABC transporter substrate-binding protein [Flavobacteriales bacterium]